MRFAFGSLNSRAAVRTQTGPSVNWKPSASLNTLAFAGTIASMRGIEPLDLDVHFLRRHRERHVAVGG